LAPSKANIDSTIFLIANQAKNGGKYCLYRRNLGLQVKAKRGKILTNKPKSGKELAVIKVRGCRAIWAAKMRAPARAGTV